MTPRKSSLKFLHKEEQDKWIDHVLLTWGDLLYDLCESILWSPSAAPAAFRVILKELKKQHEANGFKDYERAWILGVAYERLRKISARKGRRLTPSEQIMLDSSFKMESRLKQFDSWFHRLTTDEQLLLLLRDKYGTPWPEIAAATGLPEGSLKMRRQQALRTLEEWMWPRGSA